MLTAQLNARRYRVSAVGTLVLAMLTFAAARHGLRTPEPAPQETVFELTTAVSLLVQPEPPPPPPPSPPPPQPSPVQPSPVKLRAEALPRPLLPSAAPPALVERMPSQLPLAAPAADESSKLAAAPAAVSLPPVQAPPPEPVAALATPRTVEPVRPPAPAELVPPPPGVEGPYTAQVRAQLNASKRYPTGREASLQRPTGRVVVWFILARSGSLTDSGIEDSSNSILLDNAALSTVRRASFPALPDAAWPGQPSHKFTATIDFIPPT